MVNLMCIPSGQFQVNEIISNHFKFQNMLKLGCQDQCKVFLAFRTYMELCEGNNL